MQFLPIFNKKDTRLIWVKPTVPGHAVFNKTKSAVVQYCTFSITEGSIFQIIFGSFPVHSAVSYSYCSRSIKLALLDLASGAQWPSGKELCF